MPEPVERKQALLKALQDRGALNFEEIGNVVKEVGPQLMDPGVVAADYIATGVDSVIHVWKTGLEGMAGLDTAANLRREIKRVIEP